jgi:hypothetical protein
MQNTEFGRAARAIGAAASAVRNARALSPSVELTDSIARHFSALRDLDRLDASAGPRRDRLIRNCVAWRMTVGLSTPRRDSLSLIAADIAADAEWLGMHY